MDPQSTDIKVDAETKAETVMVEVENPNLIKPTLDNEGAVREMRAQISMLKQELDRSDCQIHPGIIFYFLPPHFGSRTITQHQAYRQNFPYCMSKYNGLISWTIFMVILYLSLGDFQTDFAAAAAESSYLMACSSLLVVWLLLFMNVYPIVYASVLRYRNGHWPTMRQVWSSAKEKELEKARGDGDSPVKGFWTFWMAMIFKYSIFGWLYLTIDRRSESAEIDIMLAKRRERFHDPGNVLAGDIV